MPRSTRREAVRNWLRNYVAPPRFRPALHRWVHSSDGVRVHTVTLDGPENCGVTVLLAPGFGHQYRHPKVAEFAYALSEHANVVIVALRGHGRSRGRSALGVTEHLDVAAAAALVPDDDAFVSIGVSMGSAASVLYACSEPPLGRRPDSLVSISGPAFWVRQNPPKGLARILSATESRLMRLGMRLFMRVRVGPPTSEGWVDPVDVIARFAPRPLLLVHDPTDWYFASAQVHAMAKAAGDNATVWWRDGGHATDLFTPDLYESLADQVVRPLVAPAT